MKHEESDGLHADPIYNDMNYISKMFPDIDKNEIYAYLEAHFDKKNRVQIVTDELLGADEDSQGPLKVKSVIDLTNSHSTVTPKGKNDPELGVSDVEKDVIAITAVVPDCDPNFLYERLEKMSKTADRVSVLTAQLLETRTYPKLKERLDVEQKKSVRLRLQNLDMTIKECLQMFPDPESYFNDEDKPVTETYKSHAMIQLRNEFPMLHVSYINKTFQKHKSHFAPTRQDLLKLAEQYNTSKMLINL